MNLIDEYKEILTKYASSPKFFNEALSYAIISSTLGKFVTIQMKGALPRPNLYIVLSSLPGITKRTTIIQPIQNAIENIWKMYWDRNIPKNEVDQYIQTLKKQKGKESETKIKRGDEQEDLDSISQISDDEQKEELIKERLSEFIIESFNTEGIADATEYSTQININNYIILASEFGLAFDKSKEYMDMPIILSKLYDGLGWSQRLSMRGGKKGKRSIPKGLYVTLIAEMQEAEEFFRTKHLKQGFMRKLLLCYAKPKDMGEWKTAFDPTATFSITDNRDFFNRIVKRMEELRDKKLIAVLDIDVQKEIDKKSKEIDENLRNKDKFDSDFLHISYDANIAKLCTLRAISQPTLNILQTAPNILTITMKDYKSASEFLEFVMRRQLESADKILTPEEERKVEVENPTFQRIIKTLKEKSDENEFYTTGALQKKLGMIKEKIKPFILSLIERDEINVYLGEREGRRGSYIIVPTTNEIRDDSKVIISEKGEIKVYSNDNFTKITIAHPDFIKLYW